MKADAFREELERSGPMRATMLRYAHAFFNQVANPLLARAFTRSNSAAADGC
jgi:hypothetical protein